MNLELYFIRFLIIYFILFPKLSKIENHSNIFICLKEAIRNETRLKYESKLKAHFVKMMNIFCNFNGMCDFTFAIHSYDHEDNFQP